MGVNDFLLIDTWSAIYFSFHSDTPEPGRDLYRRFRLASRCAQPQLARDYCFLELRFSDVVLPGFSDASATSVASYYQALHHRADVARYSRN